MKLTHTYTRAIYEGSIDRLWFWGTHYIHTIRARTVCYEVDKSWKGQKQKM